MSLSANLFNNFKPKSIAAMSMWLLVFMLLGMLSISNASATTDVKIGVLAKRGYQKTLDRWQPLADYLSNKLSTYHFSITPLSFDDISPAVRDHKVDFVLTNSSFYITLERKYGANRIVTMRNQVAGGEKLSQFGGVIFTRRDREDIKKLKDLHNKRFAAVDERSFGGWQMAWLEMKHIELDPQEDLAELSFVGTHDDVVYAVLEGKADVGTVRTDTLERMQLEGKINIDDFKIINQQHYPEFPLHISTALYPEWPLAQVRGTSDELSSDVAVALIQLPADSKMAQATGIAGWTTALDYSLVDVTLRELRAGYYMEAERSSFQLTDEEQAWLKKHPVLKMGVDPDFAPYEFIDTNGKHSGLAADFIQSIAKKLGIKIQMVSDLSWPDVIANMKTKNLDLISAMTKTPERIKFSTFTQPYLYYPSVIITRKNYPDLENLDELINHPVALVKDYAFTELALKQQPKIKPVYVDSVTAGLNHVVAGKVDALVVDLATSSYLMSKNNLLNLRVNTLTRFQTEGLRIAVRPDYPLLRTILDKALGATSLAEKIAIRKKWVTIDGPDKAVVKLADLTAEQKQWVNDHPTIKVHNELNWPPFNYNQNGQPIGYSIDFMNRVAASLGLKVEYVSGPSWDEFMGMVRDGSIDVMLNIISTEDRRKYLDFTKPYLEAATGVYVHEDVEGVHSLNDLVGMRVAVPRGFGMAELLSRHYPGVHIVSKKDLLESLEAVAFGEADATIGEIGVINYFIEHVFISNVKLVHQLQEKHFNQALGIAVNKKQSILRDILQKGIDVIPPEEVLELYHKWNLIIAKHKNQSASFSERDRIFLASINDIRMCVDPDWMPIEKIDSKGHHIGVGAEVINIVRGKISVPIRLVKTSSWAESLEFIRSGKCDMLDMVMRTKGRESYLNFSKPYLNMPLVIATTDEKDFIADMRVLKGHKIGIVKDYAIAAVLRENYPDNQWIEVENVKDGLEKVNAGQMYGFVDTLAVIAYTIKEYGILDVKIAGKLDEQWEMSVGTRKDWPQLILVFNKILAEIGKDAIDDIYHKKLAIKVVEEFDYKVLLKYLAIIISVFIFILYRNRQLKKFAQTQERLNLQLVEANKLIVEKEELSRSLLESTSEGIIGIDLSGVIRFINPAAISILGYTPKEMLGNLIHDLIHHSYIDGKPYPLEVCPIMQAMHQQKVQRIDDEPLWRKDGSSFPVLYSSTPVFIDGNITGAVVAFSDISELKKTQKELERLSVTDQLTGIFNRTRLDEVLDYEINTARRNQHKFSVIMSDIDNFKLVNDNYGHQVGDEVLKTMVAVLHGRVRLSDTLGRWGGEEFLIICPHTTLDNAMQLAEQLRRHVADIAFPEVGQKTASFGVACYREGDQGDDMMKRADDALYRAKENGRNRVEQEELLS